MMDISINEAIDQAVAKMRPIRRGAMQRRLQNAEYREGVANELLLKLWSDTACCELVPSLRTAKTNDAFGAATVFAIDPNNLEKFLEIIMKYLPQILELLLKFLPLFFPLFLLCTLAGSAGAQNYPSVGGVGLGSTGSVVGLGSTGSRVGLGSTGSAPLATVVVRQEVQSYGSTGSAAVQSYGSSGSSAVQSYGSTGSSAIPAKARRPLRSILENKPIREKKPIRSFLSIPLRPAVDVSVNVISAVVASAVNTVQQIALISDQTQADCCMVGHTMEAEAAIIVRSRERTRIKTIEILRF